MQDAPPDFDASDVKAMKGVALGAFSSALGNELDALGYIPAPGRSAALAKDLGLGRTQSYRLLKGLSAPTIECLGDLRAIGVSLDRLFDALSRRAPQTVDLLLNGQTIAAIVHKSPPNARGSTSIVPVQDNVFELHQPAMGQALPHNAIRIQGLQFPIRESLAIVEDDPATLSLLGAQMADTFNVAQLSTAGDLLRKGAGITCFSAFLIDWRLPDMDGGELVKRIRQFSKAPIFILTGDTTASESIANALDGTDVHHVAKPADDIILKKRINHAIHPKA